MPQSKVTFKKRFDCENPPFF